MFLVFQNFYYLLCGFILSFSWTSFVLSMDDARQEIVSQEEAERVLRVHFCYRKYEVRLVNPIDFAYKKGLGGDIDNIREKLAEFLVSERDHAKLAEKNKAQSNTGQDK